MNCFRLYTSKISSFFVLLIFAALGSGCGNQDHDSKSAGAKGSPIAISELGDKSISYQIGGSVQGLEANTSLKLSNAQEIIHVMADAAGKATFVFQNRVAPLGSYDITIVPGSTPAGMTCSLGTDASGTGINKDVTTATIACSKFTYSVGGQVSGLDAGLELVLKEPNNAPLTISVNGSFTFPSKLALNSHVRVSVDAQPTGNICSVNVPTTSVTNTVSDIVVICAKRSFKVSGAVSGLTLGQSVTLKNNGSDAQTVTYSASGSSGFTFSSPIAFGSAYTVSVGTQPASQKCTISNASGTMGASDIASVSVQCADPTYTVSTFATQYALGNYGPPAIPIALGVDPSNNIYAIDKDSNKIRKITPSGTVSHFAGTGAWGSDNGPALSASFKEPSGIVFDNGGNAYIVETYGHQIRKINTSGVVSTLTGSGTCFARDGDLASASFCGNSAIAIDVSGNLYTGDSFFELSSIRKINLSTRTVSTLAGNSDPVRSGGKGYVDGVGANARFYNIWGMAVDSSGNVYVADTANHAIRKVTPSGEVTTLAGRGPDPYGGDADGTGAMAAFAYPLAIAIDASGNLYVVDGNRKVKRITPFGVVTTIAGTGAFGATDGAGRDASFQGLSSITIDSRGNIYVSDASAVNIRKLTPN